MNPENEQRQDVTIGAAITWAVGRFRQARLDNARLTAEVLLAHVLGWERSRLIGHVNDSLGGGAQERFRVLVRRHVAGEPLQYLTGGKEFYGLPFLVTPAVLIPRPETEILVEKALDLARNCEGVVRIVDVGTGSGCIAISLAHELPRAFGWATDISLGALALARMNASRLGVGARIEFVCCDLLAGFPARPLFDLILSNPPYIAASEMSELPRMVREHEPLQALFGGEAGLDAYRRLIPQAATRLLTGGSLLLEVGAGQANEVGKLIEQEGLALTETIEDLQGIPRCLVARRSSNERPRAGASSKSLHCGKQSHLNT